MRETFRKWYEEAFGGGIAEAVKDALEPEKVNFLEEFCSFNMNLFVREKLKINIELAKEILPKLKSIIEKIPDYTEIAVYDAVKSFIETSSYKSGQVFWAFRIALTGKESTPGGAIEMADILGKERVLERLNFSIKLLS